MGGLDLPHPAASDVRKEAAAAGWKKDHHIVWPDYADQPNATTEWNCLLQEHFEWRKYFAAMVLVRMQLVFPSGVQHPPAVEVPASDLVDGDIVGLA